MMPREEIYVPDTSVVIEGIVSKMIVEGKVSGKIILHKAVLAELENQANQGKAVGFAGLQEVKKLRELSEEGLIEFEIRGEAPRASDVKQAHLGTIDRLIRDLAWELDATLITGDRVQAEVAKALGLKVIFVEPKKDVKLSIDEMFDKDTMSIHLKEGSTPKAKKGRPGYWKIVELSNYLLSREYLEKVASEIVEAARVRDDGFIEIDRRGSTIIQLGAYRIVITRPPLSDGWEITVVKPLVKLSLEDYKLPTKLLKRLKERAEGILVAGAPGMGKTTFAQALAEYYASQGKIVKTVESPRDMRLPEEITQYSKTYASSSELHDILLLSRPDYTFFDEMRDSEDFMLYTDLRLAGIGMVGVVHASSPIDAVQRFIGRVELGMIPSIIDTVIFIDRGEVSKVYEIKMTVKLPTGLREADLARPVIEVRDFLTGELEYEMYTFGEETVVIPVKKLRERRIEPRMLREIDRIIPGAIVEFQESAINVLVPKEAKKLSSRTLKKLKRLEEKYGVTLKIRLQE